MDLKERYTFVPPNGESWELMNHRLKVALETIGSTNKNVAVVTHGGAMRALMPLLMDMPKEHSFQFDFDNASITIFEKTDDRYKELVSNSTAHLR